jgi:hypothetical protein
VVSVYVPNGRTIDDADDGYKLSFLEALAEQIGRNLSRTAGARYDGAAIYEEVICRERRHRQRSIHGGRRR